MFFNEDPKGNDREKESITFDDVMEENEYKQYLIFCQEKGPIYYRSFNFLILYCIVLLFLCYFSKVFFILIIIAIVNWNTCIQFDWELYYEEFVQEDPKIMQYEDMGLDLFVDPYVLYFYNHVGIIVRDIVEFKRYCELLFYYTKGYNYNWNFYNKNILGLKYLNKYLFKFDKLSFDRKLINKKKLKVIDHNKLKNYNLKDNVIYTKTDVFNLIESNDKIINLINFKYNYNIDSKNWVYLPSFVPNMHLSWLDYNSFIKKVYISLNKKNL